MGPQQIQPETVEERLVYRAIVWTWVFWLLGLMYLVGPIVGFVLLLIVVGRYLGLLSDPQRRPMSVPIGVILWIIGMLAMEVALVVGHLDFELGFGQLVKSSVGWAKGWALLGVFPLVGAMLSVRAALLYRATGILALQTLIVAPLLWAAGLAGLPMDLYVSPLHVIGPGKEFFDVTLYAIDDTDGSLRWRFFAPWATASAFVACIGLLFALYERKLSWRLIGIASALVVCWMAGSRSSIVALPVIVVAVAVAANLHRPQMWVALAFAIVGLVLTLDLVLLAIEDSQTAFNAARAASSRVRAMLNNIGYHRWYTEAFWFGHGTVERGPHLVQFMAIGSHHTWYGLLFVKGIVGFVAFAVPLAWSIVELTIKAQSDRTARSALGIVLALGLFSFADNLEIVTYLLWPGLLLIGIGLRRRFFNPYVQAMRGPQRSNERASWPSEPSPQPA
ncbi:MAG: hypothetical protein ACR2PI_21975 [Hyphomicrobiaceae bacterium]